MTAPLTPEDRALVFLTPAARKAHERRLWVNRWGADASPCERCEAVPGVRHGGPFEGEWRCEDCCEVYDRDDEGNAGDRWYDENREGW